jgi:hypothetical protein
MITSAFAIPIRWAPAFYTTEELVTRNERSRRGREFLVRVYGLRNCLGQSE